MPALRPEQLDGHLARELRPLYAIHGDEPLLSLEAGDAIRRKAREKGFSERVTLTAERNFGWGELAASAASISLFGERKLIELRIPSGKPGTDGAQAIEAHCENLPPDALTLVMLPRLDRAGQSSAWFQALESRGTVVNVFPVDRARLPSGSARGWRGRSRARSPRPCASSPTASRGTSSPRTRRSRNSRCSCRRASCLSRRCAKR
jgi:DNA polymerase-3 subunit delta